MRVVPAVLGAAASIALAASGAAPAAPERDTVIRMGRAIGKVELGMTLPQVRRALGGRHAVVYYRFDLGPRGRYLELGWELPGRTSWDPDIWRVGFRSTSPDGPLLATRVATTARGERTPQSLGIGSRVRQLVRAYPDATCVSRVRFIGPVQAIPHPGTWVVVTSPDGGMTAFLGRQRGPARAVPTPLYVASVMVQRRWLSRGFAHQRCYPGWESR